MTKESKQLLAMIFGMVNAMSSKTEPMKTHTNGFMSFDSLRVGRAVTPHDRWQPCTVQSIDDDVVILTPDIPGLFEAFTIPRANFEAAGYIPLS